MNRFKKYTRITGKVTLGAFLLLCLAIIIVLFPYFWRHWYTYPSLEDERQNLLHKYQSPEKLVTKSDFKGVLHAHHYWSHDSRGILAEILPAAKKAGLQYVFFSDHVRNQLDSFPRGIKGVIDGILFKPGTESNGMMISPPDSLIIDWSKDKNLVIKEVADKGGLIFYVHSEEPHDWSNTDYHGMEIYNIHTDFIDEDGILPVLFNSLVNGTRFRHWVYRELYDDQTNILSLWDSLNNHRKIVGIGSVDAHNNQSLRARYTDEGKVEWVGPNAKTIDISEPGFKEWLLLNKPDTAGWAFKFEVDTYFASFNYVNTHVFADTSTVQSINHGLKNGNAYISFENLAAAKGFQFVALDSNSNVAAIMGDSVVTKQVMKLKAVSPYPVQFRLIKNGENIHSVENVYQFEFDIHSSPGNYRVEAALLFDEKWYSWIYTNPIYIF